MGILKQRVMPHASLFFCCLHKPPLSAENHNALNLGARGRAPQTSINGNAEGFSSPVRKYPVPSIDVVHPVRRRKATEFLPRPLFLLPLTVCPFGVNDHAESVFKRYLSVIFRVVKLLSELVRHWRHPHFFQEGDRFGVVHFFPPSLLKYASPRVIP